MWIFSQDGFYSIVQKPNDTQLTIRARCAEDLDRLRVRWLPTLSATIHGGGTDYPVRARCERREVADALLAMTLAIDYSNFKSRLATTCSKQHTIAAHQVWDAMHVLEDLDSATDVNPPKGMKAAYGGVVMSEDRQRILLREPTNHFGGYVWTFAKGRPNPGESPEQCARREIEEELGCTVRDITWIPGWFAGDTTATKFLIGVYDQSTQPPQADETASVQWATWQEADALIRLTQSAKGRRRDLEVLAAARKLVAI